MFDSLKKNADIYVSLEETDQPMTWCDDCGNYGIQKALFQALTLEWRQPSETIVAYDVGCSGNESDKVGLTTIHGLHGRVLPLATGIKIAHPEMTVIAHAGDGATLSEWINHLIHTIRHDRNILFIHHVNATFGLTTGQASSVTTPGTRMNAAPRGVDTPPVDSLRVLSGCNPSFVARTLSYDMDHMTEVFQAGLRHPGFAYIEVLQLCPTYNRVQNREWYERNIVHVWNGYMPNHESFLACLKLAKMPVGILLNEPRQDIQTRKNLIEEVRKYDIAHLLA
jgi:2-oxoglutarate/2-oxoacid ferredoxin oxidoreductase subunit beta